jgi:hypothetical protein
MQPSHAGRSGKRPQDPSIPGEGKRWSTAPAAYTPGGVFTLTDHVEAAVPAATHSEQPS